MKKQVFLTLLLASLGSAAVVSVPPGGLGGFTLDIDSDGVAEFTDFGFWAEANQIAFLFNVDGIDIPTMFPDDIFAGYRGQTFASKEALISSSMFSGDLTVPTGYTRLNNNITGFVMLGEDAPIFAAWMYGSLGEGSEELRLLAMIVDATEFFASDHTSNLRIFFHDYGSFAGGEDIAGVSLAETGINNNASSQLDADVEFIGPKTGLIRVASKQGATYRLKRGTNPDTGVTIATLIGTGETLTLSWDDSETTDKAAFFWVEEVSP
jgi:hypothetical protein